MIEIRARLWALYHLTWVIALFCFGVWFMRWALQLGLSNFFMVLPEWVLWMLTALVVLNFLKARATHRRNNQNSENIYWYSSSEPRYIGKFVEELCLKRRWQLPHIVIVKEGNLAEMFDDIQRPDLLILKKSTVDSLNPSELRGVIAHELRHSDATDTKLIYLYYILDKLFVSLWFWGGVAYVFFGNETFSHKLWAMTWGISLLIFVNFVARLLILAMVRSMEYKTDILAALDTGEPKEFLLGLEKLTNGTGYQLFAAERKSIPFFGHILEWLDSLHLSHPTLKQRHRSLEKVFGELSFQAPNIVLQNRYYRRNQSSLGLVQNHST